MVHESNCLLYPLLCPGQVYIAFIDDNCGSKTVSGRKFDTVDWVDVGPPAFLSGVDFISLAVGNQAAGSTSNATDSGPVPYLAYTTSSNTLGVRGFIACTAWTPLDATSLAAYSASGDLSIKVDAAGRPIVAFRNAASGNKAAAIWYNNNAWSWYGDNAASATLSDGAIDPCIGGWADEWGVVDGWVWVYAGPSSISQFGVSCTTCTRSPLLLEQSPKGCQQPRTACVHTC